jgi:hypothetical protein
LERKLSTQDPQYIEDLIQTQGSIKKTLTKILYTKKGRSFKSDPDAYSKPNFLNVEVGPEYLKKKYRKLRAKGQGNPGATVGN